MKSLPASLRSVFGMALTAWVVVGLAFSLLGGTPGLAAFGAGVAGAIILAFTAWWLSGVVPLPSRPGPTFYAIHGVAGLCSGSLMILVTYWQRSVATDQSIRAVARAADFLGAEFAFWIWLYAILIAGSYGSRFTTVVQAEREAAMRAEARAAEARLAVLKGQLNPHFLFNALHSVSALIRRDPDQAELALERLGDLLRVSLDDVADGVTIAEELRFTRDYLELEQLGMGERLVYDIDADESALDAVVPPFALQVLAENAVRHGIAPRPRGGRISIEIREGNETIRLSVRDDGLGTSALEPPREDGALANLKDRLAGLYGERATLNADSPETGGFVAQLDIPRT